MSLNSLTSSRVARDLKRTPPAAASDDSIVADNSKDVQNALSALVEYVPTETVALYLTTLALVPTAKLSWLNATSCYVGFAILTPMLFALIYVGKRRAAGQLRMPNTKDWPWWPMVASTIAFLAWGLTVPGAPFFNDEGQRAITGVLAILVSTLLGVLGRVFAPPPA